MKTHGMIRPWARLQRRCAPCGSGKARPSRFFVVSGSSGSRERAVAETMLHDQLGQRERGAPVLPDPRRLSLDQLRENL